MYLPLLLQPTLTRSFHQIVEFHIDTPSPKALPVFSRYVEHNSVLLIAHVHVHVHVNVIRAEVRWSRPSPRFSVGWVRIGVFHLPSQT